MSEQLDLLDCIDGETRGTAHQDQKRFAAVLTCMRDAMPDTMRFVIDLWAPPSGWGAAGGWSFKWTDASVTVDPHSEVGQQSITWDEFAALVEDHPDRSAVLAWDARITAVDKWRDLYRPNELWPFGLDTHPSNIEADHDRPGWDERLTAWQTVQAILTDAIAEAAPDAADFDLPVWAARRPVTNCEHCGAEIKVGSYGDELNHARMGDTCTSRWLTRNHARLAEELLDPANRGDGMGANCSQHSGRKKPCPQECFTKDYEFYANRATERWGSEEWRNTK